MPREGEGPAIQRRQFIGQLNGVTRIYILTARSETDDGVPGPMEPYYPTGYTAIRDALHTLLPDAYITPTLYLQHLNKEDGEWGYALFERSYENNQVDWRLFYNNEIFKKSDPIPNKKIGDFTPDLPVDKQE